MFGYARNRQIIVNAWNYNTGIVHTSARIYNRITLLIIV